MKCPGCSTEGAYQGAMVVECVSRSCRHFNQKLFDGQSVTVNLGKWDPKPAIVIDRARAAANPNFYEGMEVSVSTEKLLGAFDISDVLRYNRALSAAETAASYWSELKFKYTPIKMFPLNIYYNDL